MEQLQEQQEVKLISMDMIQSQQVEWLWYPYIPFGKITIVQGDPGEGKTTFALNLAARISKGERFGQEDTTGVPLSVIYQTAEDGLSDTVKPRLEEAKADCSRILVIDDREKSLTMDDDRLEKAINATGARLLILDPIQAMGLVPKTYLPNYGEFYERRQFNPAPAGVRTLHFAGQEVPFGTQLVLSYISF